MPKIEVNTIKFNKKFQFEKKYNMNTGNGE